jgi:peptide/nickel transport system substrate-binding protein
LAGTSSPLFAKEILILSEDVPAGLNYDGPSAAIPASQQGMVTLLEPLVGYAAASTNDTGVSVPDFNKFEGRLAESWTFDPATLTWTVRRRMIWNSRADFVADGLGSSGSGYAA